MKNKTNFLRLPLIFTVVFLFLTYGCLEEDQSIIPPSVESLNVFDIKSNSFKFKGMVIDEGSGYLRAGAIAATGQFPSIDDSWKDYDWMYEISVKLHGEGEYVADFSNLSIQSNTRYYVRAYITYYTDYMVLDTETKYGSQISFMTGGLNDNDNDNDNTEYFLGIGKSHPEYGTEVEGTGWYNSGDKVEIKAIYEGDLLVFDEWVGDIEYLNNPYSQVTNVTMPSKNINFTAYFKYK